MQCPKCASQTSLWKWVRETPRPYRVSCNSCGFFIMWGSPSEWIDEEALNKGSIKIDRPLQDVDVSDLFR